MHKLAKDRAVDDNYNNFDDEFFCEVEHVDTSLRVILFSMNHH